MEKDLKFLNKYFKNHNMRVVDEFDGEDVDGDGREFEYHSFIFETNHIVTDPVDEFDDWNIVNNLEYFTDFDYNLDRGLYQGPARNNQFEIRFTRELEDELDDEDNYDYDQEDEYHEEDDEVDYENTKEVYDLYDKIQAELISQGYDVKEVSGDEWPSKYDDELVWGLVIDNSLRAGIFRDESGNETLCVGDELIAVDKTESPEDIIAKYILKTDI